MARRRLRFSILLTTAMLCAGCADDPPLSPTFTSIQHSIFDVYCSRPECHGDAAIESRLPLEPGAAYTNLVNQPSIGIPERMRVVPGHPEQSYLMQKLTGTDIVGERMPIGQPPLSDSLIGIVRDWIAAGAPKD